MFKGAVLLEIYVGGIGGRGRGDLNQILLDPPSRPWVHSFSDLGKWEHLLATIQKCLLDPDGTKVPPACHTEA